MFGIYYPHRDSSLNSCHSSFECDCVRRPDFTRVTKLGSVKGEVKCPSYRFVSQKWASSFQQAKHLICLTNYCVDVNTPFEVSTDVREHQDLSLCQHARVLLNPYGRDTQGPLLRPRDLFPCDG